MAFLVMCLALAGLVLYEWITIFTVRSPLFSIQNIKWVIFGLAYAVMAAVLLPFIRGVSAPDGLALISLLFLVVWVTDIAAYFCGRALGGPKLWLSVSPNKTWSGALGGLGFSVFAAFVFGYYVSGFSAFSCAAGAVVMSIFSQCGDLLESAFKREFGAKDSSQLIPGHGGFLDRVDGLLPATVPLAIYLLLTAN